MQMCHPRNKLWINQHFEKEGRCHEKRWAHMPWRASHVRSRRSCWGGGGRRRGYRRDRDGVRAGRGRGGGWGRGSVRSKNSGHGRHGGRHGSRAGGRHGSRAGNSIVAIAVGLHRCVVVTHSLFLLLWAELLAAVICKKRVEEMIARDPRAKLGKDVPQNVIL